MSIPPKILVTVVTAIIVSHPIVVVNTTIAFFSKKRNVVKIDCIEVMFLLIRLRELRQAASLSQQKLAAQLGISQQSINKYENHNVEPDLALLTQMADFFDTTVDYLIGHTDDPARPLADEERILSRDEIQLIANYRLLSTQEKELVFHVAAGYASYHKQSLTEKT